MSLRISAMVVASLMAIQTMDVYADIPPPRTPLPSPTLADLSGGVTSFGAAGIVGVMALVVLGIIVLMAWWRRRS